MIEGIEKIPEHCRGGVERYICEGRCPGHFLTAIFENNLVSSFARADGINKDRIYDYVDFLFTDAPTGCWGSREIMDKWIMKGGLKGIENAKQKTADAL